MPRRSCAAALSLQGELPAGVRTCAGEASFGLRGDSLTKFSLSVFAGTSMGANGTTFTRDEQGSASAGASATVSSGRKSVGSALGEAAAAMAAAGLIGHGRDGEASPSSSLIDLQEEALNGSAITADGVCTAVRSRAIVAGAAGGVSVLQNLFIVPSSSEAASMSSRACTARLRRPPGLTCGGATPTSCSCCMRALPATGVVPTGTG
mmetsp:Transcript_50764/g.114138  ORF Transcript_50764/g.114138 Transcript_50764/m.114138 type:complete len:207 (+) Transcript_50764:361-981(+)